MTDDAGKSRKPAPRNGADDETGRDDKRTKALQPFGTVWAGRQRVDPVFERDTEMAKIARQITSTGRSFVVVGRAGVGKTAILRGVIHGLAALPADRAWRVVQTSANGLIAGKMFLGEWQGHVEKLLAAAERRRRAAIWLTDLVQGLKTGRSSGGDTSVLDFMASAIEQGRVIVFGEATPEAFESGFARHPRLSRLFDQIRVEPQPAEVVGRIVAAVAAQRLSRAPVPGGATLTWQPAAIERCVQLGQAFFPAQCPPSGAARLVEAVLEEEPVAKLVAQPRDADDGSRVIPIPPTAVVEALVRLTGAPRVMLDDALPLAMADVRRFFENRIVGQRQALDTVVDLVATIKAGLSDPARPAGVLLFVGPTGVGKTELARTLAEFVFGHADRLIRLDMSEYARPDAVPALLGWSHEAERGSAHGLLDRVHQQPFSVVLLDEIEKAHDTVFDLLLQLFDAGRLTRTSGETVNFTQTVIILTSNLGAGAPPAAEFGFRPGEPPSAEELVRGAVQQFFRPELVNRIGRIVVFEPLSKADVRTIAQRELGQVLLRSGIVRRRLQVDVDRGVVDLLAEAGYDPRMGARPLKRAVDRLVVGPLAHVLAETGGTRVPTLVHLRPLGDRVRVEAIHDDRSRRQEDLPHVAAPFDGRTREATPEALRGWVEELREAVDEALAAAAGREVNERRSAIVAATAAATFWDEPATAREQLAELYRLERVAEALAACSTEARRIEEATRRLDRRTAASRGAALARDIDRCHRQASILRFAVLCDVALRRRDAFVVYETRDPAGGPHVGQLAECHGAWADRLGYEVLRIHEEAGDGAVGPVAQVVLQINGAAVAGMLEAEDGFHEFADGRSASRLVKVTVMPAVPEDDGDVTTEVGEPGRDAAGAIVPVRATHRPSGRTVAIRSRQPRADAVNQARELLAAEMARQRTLVAAAPHPAIVRRWWLGDNPDVRDPRTGVTVPRLKEVQNGQIEPFLLAFLERQPPAARLP
jgi:ATP-dependent Clp protease ATP-binding subunit ClpC